MVEKSQSTTVWGVARSSSAVFPRSYGRTTRLQGATDNGDIPPKGWSFLYVGEGRKIFLSLLLWGKSKDNPPTLKNSKDFPPMLSPQHPWEDRRVLKQAGRILEQRQTRKSNKGRKEKSGIWCSVRYWLRHLGTEDGVFWKRWRDPKWRAKKGPCNEGGVDPWSAPPNRTFFLTSMCYGRVDLHNLLVWSEKLLTFILSFCRVPRRKFVLAFST